MMFHVQRRHHNLRMNGTREPVSLLHAVTATLSTTISVHTIDLSITVIISELLSGWFVVEWIVYVHQNTVL